MPSSIKDYRNLIDQPYGRMFYDLIYRQLNIQTKPTLDILDFGAGFCVTANHYPFIIMSLLLSLTVKCTI